ncbi:hypothetical protein D5086_019433 [Populus alba]|uniref:Uncharacterized protein n=1 Tax=Populus alba TaxID=43335 RepID=A0ACC4BIP4_POPAL
MQSVNKNQSSKDQSYVTRWALFGAQGSARETSLQYMKLNKEVLGGESNVKILLCEDAETFKKAKVAQSGKEHV